MVMELSFHAHAFLFYGSGSIIGIYLLDLSLLTFYDAGYETRIYHLSVV